MRGMSVKTRQLLGIPKKKTRKPMEKRYVHNRKTYAQTLPPFCVPALAFFFFFLIPFLILALLSFSLPSSLKELFFFFHPIYYHRTTSTTTLLALPPNSNSDPGSHIGLPSPPSPLRYNNASIFIASRFRHFLPSSTRVELYLPTLLGALSSCSCKT